MSCWLWSILPCFSKRRKHKKISFMSQHVRGNILLVLLHSNAAGFGLVCSNRTHERIFSLALCNQSKKKALSICSRFHNQRRLPVLLLTFPFPGNGFDSLFGPAAPERESESANHKMTWFFKIEVPPEQHHVRSSLR